ncbi:hypothetical protein HZI73_07110 [Vallitalea pronyensis]|uniref:Glycoside hydrolase family 38 central domain-containing protein n=1 Tax=Vallitalea pronyensis TaxID=1348613 RepID=A0A8J8MII5_9FIRM|nr:alpha-mannosidase [Vallitalea pronyensis]QUI22081.1 hypothetical protein HZI73_07110 [Vallitalea pronyensis]
MKKRDDLGHHWQQMVQVYNPERQQKPYWEDRCLQQLKMAGEYVKHMDDRYGDLVEETAVYVNEYMEKHAYVSKEVCEEVEKRLTVLSGPLKGIKVHCVSHAHIDMNWMWGFHETVEVVLATLDTMVNLLEEYPDFTFSQSQASVYRIVERYDQNLLEKIKKYVKEGRFEISASTWVEHDKNMVGSESFARHLLYTRNYLCDTFDMKPEDFTIDFEPDTFGHSAFVPDVLSQAGIKYYYHCRGLNDTYLYKWISPSGASIIGYSEPVWYGNSITTGSFIHIPMLAKEIGINETMFVYGVGDHGGGPSRQDIQRIRDISSWPLMPNLVFSTYKNFFDAVAEREPYLPVVEGEINPLFTGCYTSTSRIKMANKYGEKSLMSTEFAATMANQINEHPYDFKGLESSWEKHLFNQFHDILPGCGINFTLEHALGNFQEILAVNNVIKRKALEAIASNIDTRHIRHETAETGTAESAGFGVDLRALVDNKGISYGTGLTQRGRYSGGTRLYTLFNHTQYTRHENVEIVLWDYREDLDKICIYNSQGKVLDFIIEGSHFNQYWGHWFTKLIVKPEIPAFGYEVIIISSDGEGHEKSKIDTDSRTKTPPKYCLENRYISVTFDPVTMDIISLYSKLEDCELLSEKGSNFRYIKEDSKTASAWVIGDYVTVDNCLKEVTERKFENNALYARASFKMKVNGSILEVMYTIGCDDQHIHVHVKNHWNEIGCEGFTPQLQYKLDLKNPCKTYSFNVPMGLVDREPANDDLAGLDFAYANQPSSCGLYVCSDSKYGYRTLENSMALSLIRSSRSPNSHPENGTHLTDFIIGTGDITDAYREASFLNIPVESVNIPLNQTGQLPLNKSFMSLDTTSIIITSVKKAQNGEGIIIKFYLNSDQDEKILLRLPKTIKGAYLSDVLENALQELTNYNENKLILIAKARGLSIIRVIFD